MHDLPPLLTTLAAAFTAAWVLGLLTQWLKLSPIVGYLLAGVLLGEHTPGFRADATLAPQLAELGVVLLMFGVGMHFHLKDLVAVRWIAVPGALGQSAVATLAGALLFPLFGLPLNASIVLGMAMAVASTVVLMRVLIDGRRLNTVAGHVAVGWLIVEDVLTVILLILLPMMAVGMDVNGAAVVGGVTADAGESHLPAWTLQVGAAMGKLALMVVVVMVGGTKLVPWILVRVARLRSRELFTLTVLVLSIAVATVAAQLFGASVALGAFLAGLVVAQSPVSQQAANDALPLRDAFSVLFFVSVGMLFDPAFLMREPMLVLGGLGIVMVVKPVIAVLIVAALGHPLVTGMTVAVGLAQIGEFSFILGESAFRLGILPDEGRQLLVACALVSITLNPVLFRTLPPLEGWLRKQPWLWGALMYRANRRAERGNARAMDHVGAVDIDQTPLAVIVGYGPVGRQVDRLLREAGRETMIVELSIDSVSALTAEGRAAIYGDAAQIEVLSQAGLARASHLVLTTPHSPDLPTLITAAKRLNPTIRILMRTRYLREEPRVLQLGAAIAVVDEVESAVALAEQVLRETGADEALIRSEAERVRHDLSAHERPSHR
jgi:CPA2 family monovalent cation:H+ antiporter-2